MKRKYGRYKKSVRKHTHKVILPYKMIKVEVRMIKMMYEITKDDRIKNEYIMGNVGLTSIVDEMRGNMLR